MYELELFPSFDLGNRGTSFYSEKLREERKILTEVRWAEIKSKSRRCDFKWTVRRARSVWGGGGVVNENQRRFSISNARYQSILSSISTTNPPANLFPIVASAYEPRETRKDIYNITYGENRFLFQRRKVTTAVAFHTIFLSRRYYYWLTIFILMKIFVFFLLQHYFLIFFSSVSSPYIVHINMHFRYAIYVYIARFICFRPYFLYLTDTMFLYICGRFEILAAYLFFFFLFVLFLLTQGGKKTIVNHRFSQSGESEG